MIKERFRQRRSRFHRECLNYLRYVLNDHFVLFSMLFLGFLLLQYSNFLKNPPKDPFFVLCLVLLPLFSLPFLGSLATFVAEADKHYLLIKETEVAKELDRAFRVLMIWGVFWQTLVLVFLTPLLSVLGLPIWAILSLGVIFAVLRFVFFKKKKDSLKRPTGLDWERLIFLEKKRQQRILSFFALFTQVKGLTTSVKRRAYLDGLLRLFSNSQQVWLQLYSRAFLRSGDYLGLSLRLVGLSLIIAWFLPQKIVVVALIFLLNYLLLFQLLGLSKTYDYQYLTMLFPVDSRQKTKSLKTFLSYLAYATMFLEVFFVFDLKAIFFLIVGQVILVELYLPYKLKKIVDEVV